MGWLYMQSLNGHGGPKEYLDAQFTYDRPHVLLKVLRSVLVDGRVYYAAVECSDREAGTRHVFAVVCLVNYNLRAADGYVFGYKDMDETMGPYEIGCPEDILDLLTPTDSAYAKDWRARCRAALAARKAFSAGNGAPKVGGGAS